MKKFVAILSIIFTFITIPCCFIYYMGSTSYVDKFFTEQMIPLMGTILALNFALVTSLQIFLLQIEDKFEKKMFHFNSQGNKLKYHCITCYIWACVYYAMHRY